MKLTIKPYLVLLITSLLLHIKYVVKMLETRVNIAVSHCAKVKFAKTQFNLYKSTYIHQNV